MVIFLPPPIAVNKEIPVIWLMADIAVGFWLSQRTALVLAAKNLLAFNIQNAYNKAGH